MDRYRVRVDKGSQIRNDPNEWSDDPRYIVDLLKRIATVSPADYGDRRQEIVDNLPALEVVDRQPGLDRVRRIGPYAATSHG